MSDVVDAIDVASWVAGLDAVFARVAGRFGRVEPRRQARAYLVGLLAPVERKNSWQLAEAAGDATPDKMQRLLNRARWDPDAVRADVRAYVAEHLGDADGVLIVDETGFVKKGEMSAVVQRQYSGTAGRLENCKLGVFCTYASPKGLAMIDRELYLPHSWTDDRPRCRAAGVPDQVEFATKPTLAGRMLTRALHAGVPAGWVAADEAYGQHSKFRTLLDARGVGYVLAVPCRQRVGLGAGSARADSLAAQAPTRAWKRLSGGQGSKGPRLYDWAVAALPGAHPGRGRWLLLRRSITDPQEIAYYLCAGPAETTVDTLVRVAGARWAVEESFRHAKMGTGLDHYQVRRYDAWYRHVTLSMLAFAFLAVTTATSPKAAAGLSTSVQARSAVCWLT